MKICIYGNTPSVDETMHETLGLFPHLLLTEKVKYCSKTSGELIIYLDFEHLNDEMLISSALHFFAGNIEVTDLANQLLNYLPQYKRFSLQKHKDRNAVIFMGRYKSRMNEIKNLVKKNQIFRLEQLKITELLPFDKDDVWELIFPSINSDPDQEETIIQQIATALIDRDYILSFDIMVEELFGFTLPDVTELKNFEFIKIPLWDFPCFEGMKYPQMKYTRDDLQPALYSFNVQLDKLSKLLLEIPFSNKTAGKIKQMLNETIGEQWEPIQKKINESLYLIQARNQFSSARGSKFCLGIASNETLVDYYERAKIIEPYIANEIKQRVGRHCDLKSSNLFCYNEFRSS